MFWVFPLREILEYSCSSPEIVPGSAKIWQWLFCRPSSGKRFNQWGFLIGLCSQAAALSDLWGVSSLFLCFSDHPGSWGVYDHISLWLPRWLQSRLQLCRVDQLRHFALDRLRENGNTGGISWGWGAAGNHQLTEQWVWDCYLSLFLRTTWKMPLLWDVLSHCPMFCLDNLFYSEGVGMTFSSYIHLVNRLFWDW